MSSLFGSSPAAPQTPAEIKAAVTRQIQQEAAMNNARSLIAKINKHCFEACVPNPGSSLSAQEKTSLSNCMDKYIAMWNVTSQTFITRIASESKNLGGKDASVLAAIATGHPKNGGGGIMG